MQYRFWKYGGKGEQQKGRRYVLRSKCRCDGGTAHVAVSFTSALDTSLGDMLVSATVAEMDYSSTAKQPE